MGWPFDNVSWSKPLGDAGTGVSWKNPFGGSSVGNAINAAEKQMGVRGPFETQQNIADTFTRGKGTWGGEKGEKGSKGAIRASLALTGPGLPAIIDQPMFDSVGDWADKMGGGGALGRVLGIQEPEAEPVYENPYENLPEFNPDSYKGFDTSQMSKTMQRDNAVRQARDQANAVAQMNQYGTLGSGQMASAQGNLIAEGERANQGIGAQLARMSYDDALRQWAMERERMSNAISERNRQKESSYRSKRDKEKSQESLFGSIAGAVAGGAFS